MGPVIKVGASRGTESLHDSPLEGNGFELPVRERGESGGRLCRAPLLGTGRRALFADRQSRTALAARQLAERLNDNRVRQYDRGGEQQEMMS